MDITDPTHRVAAGLTGTVAVTTASTAIGWVANTAAGAGVSRIPC